MDTTNTAATVANVAALITMFDDAIVLSNSSARPARLVWAGSLFGQNEVDLGSGQGIRTYKQPDLQALTTKDAT